MNSLNDILENFQEYSLQDYQKLIFHSNYFPVYYVMHAFFVVFNIRYSAPRGGVHWFRSFILGLIMSSGPRYIFTYFINRTIPEFQDYQQIIYYSVIWAILNICPFDLIYKFSSRTASKIVIQAFDAFSQAENVIILCYSGTMIFPSKPLRVGLIVWICLQIPIIADIVDRAIFGLRGKPMAYQYNYIKRTTAAVCATILLGTRDIFQPEPAIEMYHFIPILTVIYVLLSLLDYLFTGDIFFTIDIIIPFFWEEVATYHPDPYVPKHKQQKQQVKKQKDPKIKME